MSRRAADNGFYGQPHRGDRRDDQAWVTRASVGDPSSRRLTWARSSGQPAGRNHRGRRRLADGGKCSAVRTRRAVGLSFAGSSQLPSRSYFGDVSDDFGVYVVGEPGAGGGSATSIPLIRAGPRDGGAGVQCRGLISVPGAIGDAIGVGGNAAVIKVDVETMSGSGAAGDAGLARGRARGAEAERPGHGDWRDGQCGPARRARHRRSRGPGPKTAPRSSSRLKVLREPWRRVGRTERRTDASRQKDQETCGFQRNETEQNPPNTSATGPAVRKSPSTPRPIRELRLMAVVCEEHVPRPERRTTT